MEMEQRAERFCSIWNPVGLLRESCSNLHLASRRPAVLVCQHHRDLFCLLRSVVACHLLHLHDLRGRRLEHHPYFCFAYFALLGW